MNFSTEKGYHRENILNLPKGNKVCQLTDQRCSLLCLLLVSLDPVVPLVYLDRLGNLDQRVKQAGMV